MVAPEEAAPSGRTPSMTLCINFDESEKIQRNLECCKHPQCRKSEEGASKSYSFRLSQATIVPRSADLVLTLHRANAGLVRR